MAEGKPSLADVNSLLLRQLYDNISESTDSGELLNFTEAVAKLNASFRNNDRVAGAKEEGDTDREISEAFAGCQEAVITDGDT